MIYSFIVNTLSKTDLDRLYTSKLFIELEKQANDLFMNGFKLVLQNLTHLESEYHCVKSNISMFAARAVCDGLITLNDLAYQMKNGAYYPLFFLCMQNMHKLKSPEWLRSLIEKSKINLVDMLPNDDRNKDRLIQILEDRELSFVLPMLKIESILFDKIYNQNYESTQLKDWIDQNVNNYVTSSADFIHSLVTW